MIRVTIELGDKITRFQGFVKSEKENQSTGEITLWSDLILSNKPIKLNFTQVNYYFFYVKILSHFYYSYLSR